MLQSEPWTVGRLLAWTTDYLQTHGSPSARLDAEVLLAGALGCHRIELYTAFATVPEDGPRAAFRDLVRRRAQGTPVAYLVGQREFYSLDFHVTPDVLIPRPETELLVVALLDRPCSTHGLRRFAALLTGCVTIGLLLTVLTPLARFWFVEVSGLSLGLAGLAHGGLWFAIVLPALSVLESWFQGAILHSGRTRSITEAVLICFAVTGAVLAAGIGYGRITGLYIGFLALSSGELVRTVWLWWRSRAVRDALQGRDAG